MELEYQSHPNIDIDKQLNRLDKLTSKLTFTLKDLPPSDILPQHLKDKLITFISNDQTRPFLKLIDKEVITWDREVGAKGTRWNLIHLCSKFNAVNTARALLKKLYQIDPDDYTKAINTQTSQGFTPLMISIIYRGDKVLQLLLQFGGVDLSIIEGGKLRAYDLALHYRNEFAIGQLIFYQDRCRKKQYLNQQELLTPQPELQDGPNICQSFVNYLVDCFICLKTDEELYNEPQMFAKASSTGKKEGATPVDSVKVGSRKDIEDYQIQWKRLSMINGQKVALFDSFKPQDICQSQFSLRNSLIILQTLSDFPWLLRKIISRVQSTQGNPQKYNVTLCHNHQTTKIQVDQFVPVIRERGQPMFLSNRSQIWPMILQKAMAKLYGSYLTLNTLSSSEALQAITGFYVKQFPISSIGNQNGIVSSFQQLALRGYLVLLQGRPRTDLNSSMESTSYAILNYYEKGNTKKLLISCPNIVQNWKDGKENRQLAILKAHFSRHHQSCLWIDESKLQYYFTNAIVVFLKEGCIRSDLKMKLKIRNQSEPSNGEIKDNQLLKQYTKSIFFKLKIENSRDEPVLMQLTDLQSRHRFDLSNLEGWKNQGNEIMVREQEYSGCQELVKFNCSPGEYLCKFDLKAQQVNQQKNGIDANRGIIRKKQNEDQGAEMRKKVQLNLGPEHLRQLLLAVWAPEQLQLQLLEQSFGTIEWLAHYRNFAMRNWSQLIDRGQQYLSERVNGKTIVVVKKQKKNTIYLSLPAGCIGSDSILEGKWVESSQVRIEMLSQSQNLCAYCVLVGVKLQTLRGVKIQISSCQNEK